MNFFTKSDLDLFFENISNSYNENFKNPINKYIFNIKDTVLGECLIASAKKQDLN